jgi:hypothetical protein
MWQKIHCGRVEVMKQGSVLIGQRTLSLATGVGDGVLVVAVKTKTRNDLLAGGHYPSDYSVRGQQYGAIE